MKHALIRTAAALGSLLVALPGYTGQMVIGEEHYIPIAWSQPRIITDTQGRATGVQPAVPTEFVRRSVGAGMGVGKASVRAVRRGPPEYRVRLKGGDEIKVAQGRAFELPSGWYKVLGIRDGRLLIQAVASGRVLPLHSGRWQHVAPE